MTYYGYGVLGTDRYPPFTLAEVPDYPATLDLDYPEQLSRGLVLVKWWLLALPHYLLLGALTGGGLALRDSAASHPSSYNGISLATAAVFCAAIALLFVNRYPRGLFDLVMGVNRWGLRVAVYVTLMTDVYPPFRLDQGGDDPVAAVSPGADPVLSVGRTR